MTAGEGEEKTGEKGKMESVQAQGGGQRSRSIVPTIRNGMLSKSGS